MRKRRLFGKYDLLLFAAILLIVAVIYIINGRSRKGAVCEIKMDGKIVQTVDLSGHDREFELSENSHIRFKIQNNAIAFAESNCLDKICVNTGYLMYAGQSAVCMPNRVSIHIIGNNGADIVAN